MNIHLKKMNPKLRNLKSKLQKVEEFGREYYSQEHLRENPEELLSDWQKALCFFLSRVFHGGRSNELSNKYLDCACRVIKDWSPNSEWNKDSLLRSLEKAGVKKEADRKMVAGTLELISKKSEFDYDIIRYFVDSIKGKRS